MTVIRVYSTTNTTLGQVEVRPSNQTDIWAVAHTLTPLAPRPRAGRFPSPLPDQIPEERLRTNQSHPSRSPRSHSGLLEDGDQRPGHNRTDSRLPGLEGDLHLTFGFVD